jgi:phosphoribosylformimino-5-aminoimidazole carboxamide ribotide isomerase
VANKLKVIPVIDILNGIAVHAVKGIRSEYKPLQSILSDSAQPLAVAKAFRNLGFSDLYVADLDAIIDCTTSFGGLKQVAESSGIKLMVDAGITNIDRAKSLLNNGVSKVVVGTETMQSKSFVGEAVKHLGVDRVIVSLDLKGDKVLAKEGFDGAKEPISLLREFKEMGLAEVIVLDLSRVGSGEGINIDLLRKVIDEVSLETFVGGGVRSIEDLVQLRDLGVSGVLVATALHTGKISVKQLKQAKLL